MRKLKKNTKESNPARTGNYQRVGDLPEESFTYRCNGRLNDAISQKDEERNQQIRASFQRGKSLGELVVGYGCHPTRLCEILGLRIENNELYKELVQAYQKSKAS